MLAVFNFYILFFLQSMGQSKCNYHFISDIIKSFLLVHDFLNPLLLLLKSMVVIIHLYTSALIETGIDFLTSDNSATLKCLIFFLLNLKTDDPVTNLLVREEIKHRSLPADWCQDLVNTMSCQRCESFVRVDFFFFYFERLD